MKAICICGNFFEDESTNASCPQCGRKMVEVSVNIADFHKMCESEDNGCSITYWIAGRVKAGVPTLYGIAFYEGRTEWHAAHNIAFCDLFVKFLGIDLMSEEWKKS